jgi:hypothetical protein
MNPAVSAFGIRYFWKNRTFDRMKVARSRAEEMSPASIITFQEKSILPSLHLANGRMAEACIQEGTGDFMHELTMSVVLSG